MDWISLGHAGWLIEAADLRLLCDPLLAVDHYRGLFEVQPPRRLIAERLRPDFILISHAHPDHFDVPSLARLAALDAEAVVVTPDALVAEAARALGFSTVHEVGAGQRIELDAVTLVTTESLAPDEWGVMVATTEGVVWNQVDTVFDGPAHARRVRDASLAALGRERVDLALVSGRPMHEIAAQLGRAIGLPLATYAGLLDELAAIEPVAIVPASADTAHVAAFAWLNHIVYPVDADRFARDLGRRCPSVRVLPGVLGGRYRVRRGAVELHESGGSEYVECSGASTNRRYRPFEIPALRDPGDHDDLGARKAEVRRWITEELGPALVAAAPGFAVAAPLRFVVEAVFPDQRPGSGEAWTLEIPAGTVEPGADPGWDHYNLIAGTMLWEVISGRRSWGDVLLAGAIRAASRSYAIDEHGLTQSNVGEIFLYYALSYDDSIRRAVEWEIAQLSV